MHLHRQKNCWSLRCSWNIACRRCSNHIRIFTLDLTPGFNGLDKDNCKTRRESSKFWDVMHLILEILRYMSMYWQNICLSILYFLIAKHLPDDTTPVSSERPLNPLKKKSSTSWAWECTRENDSNNYADATKMSQIVKSWLKELVQKWRCSNRCLHTKILKSWTQISH